MNAGFLLAAKYGQIDELKRYLDAGQDPNESTHDGYTALMVAARQGAVDSVRLLVERGAVTTGEWGWKALDRSMERGHDDIVELLLANGGDALRLLADAPTNCRQPVVRRFGLAQLERGGEFDPEQLTSALNSALRWSDYELAAALLGNRADPNRRDTFGRAPLEVAADEAIEHLLISAGADPTRCGGCSFLLGPIDVDCPVCNGAGFESTVRELNLVRAEVEQCLADMAGVRLRPANAPEVDGDSVVALELAVAKSVLERADAAHGQLYRGEIDFDSIVRVFDRLRMPSGYKLAYVRWGYDRRRVVLPVEIDPDTVESNLSTEALFENVQIEDSALGYFQYFVFRMYVDYHRPELLILPTSVQGRANSTWTDQVALDFVEWPEYIRSEMRALANRERFLLGPRLTGSDRKRIDELAAQLAAKPSRTGNSVGADQLVRMMHRAAEVRKAIEHRIPDEVNTYRQRALIQILDLRPAVVSSTEGRVLVTAVRRRRGYLVFQHGVIDQATRAVQWSDEKIESPLNATVDSSKPIGTGPSD